MGNLFRQKQKTFPDCAGPPKKLPENLYSIPGKLKQIEIFFTRDLLIQTGKQAIYPDRPAGSAIAGIDLRVFHQVCKRRYIPVYGK